MPAAANLGILSLVPQEVQALFGDPPLLRGKDEGLYDTLMSHFTKIVGPRDMIEWWWVKDMTDHSWEIRRLRRFKVLFVELRRDKMVEARDRFAYLTAGEDGEYAREPVPESEKDSAGLFMDVIDQYKKIDTLIASAELRRDRTLREIERRRHNLARRLRKASDEIIDDKFAELPQAA
jgi:hypothetical protein